MEIERKLFIFWGFVYEAVHDAFVYLAEVFCALFQSRQRMHAELRTNLVVLLKPFRFMHEYFKIYVRVYLARSDYELHEL
jgi:hypothetical protein